MHFQMDKNFSNTLQLLPISKNFRFHLSIFYSILEHFNYHTGTIHKSHHAIILLPFQYPNHHHKTATWYTPQIGNYLPDSQAGKRIELWRSTTKKPIRLFTIWAVKRSRIVRKALSETKWDMRRLGNCPERLFQGGAKVV